MSFMTEVTNDLDAIFFNTDELGIEVDVTTSTGTKTIKAQFFKGNLDKLESTYSYLWCATADVSGVAVNNLVVIAGETYGIVDMDTEDTGTTTFVFVNKV